MDTQFLDGGNIRKDLEPRITQDGQSPELVAFDEREAGGKKIGGEIDVLAHKGDEGRSSLLGKGT